MRIKKKRYKKIIMLIIFSVIFCMITVIGYIFFCSEQLQYGIKERTFTKVIKHEDELLETVEECRNERAIYLIDIKTKDDYYKKLNNEIINKTFNNFHLIYIRDFENGNMKFVVRPSIVSILWNDYIYGFYYSKNDTAINVIETGNECEAEFENLMAGYGRYWYRTERITDNWWFYETKRVSRWIFR